VGTAIVVEGLVATAQLYSGQGALWQRQAQSLSGGIIERPLEFSSTDGHTHSSDLEFLVVSPSGKAVVLMSRVGGTNSVDGATLVFRQQFPAAQPPDADPIPSHATSYFLPSNYGGVVLPQVGSDPPPGPSFYQPNLAALVGDNPNGRWTFYIYDDHQPGGVGELTGSWRLDFDFQ
jgi:hypothetical protein